MMRKTAFFFGWLLASIAGASANDKVKSCFEGPALAEAKKSGVSDELTRNLGEMFAGKLCEPVAQDVIDGCLAELAADNDDDKDTYRCIGVVANPCMTSAFASSAFRKVVCIGAEEAAWGRHLDQNRAKLRARLVTEETKKQFEETDKAFYALRDLQCGLTRTVFEKSEPDVAYSACVTEAAARFVIDLREMNAEFDKAADASSQPGKK